MLHMSVNQVPLVQVVPLLVEWVQVLFGVYSAGLFTPS